MQEVGCLRRHADETADTAYALNIVQLVKVCVTERDGLHAAVFPCCRQLISDVQPQLSSTAPCNMQRTSWVPLQWPQTIAVDV
jgi:hypothetical protein